MTSVSGCAVVKAPCCGTLYSKTAYGSINMIGWQRWSDGAEGGSLYSKPASVCHCGCGQFFLTKDAEHIEYVRFQYRGCQPIQPEDEPEPPKRLPYVFQEEAFDMVAHDKALPGGKIEAYIRLLVWQALNDKDRIQSEDGWGESRAWVVAELRKKLGNQFKEPQPKPWTQLSNNQAEVLQLANLSKLIPLLESWFPQKHLLIGNAYRAVGDQPKAIGSFSRAKNESPKIVQHLINEAKEDNRKVIRMEPPEWLPELVMPEPWINTKPGKNPIVLTSRWFWFKIFGMLNQLWALIESRADSEMVTIYWIDDNASIIKSEEYASEDLAWAELQGQGYKLFEEEPDVWEIMCPPGGPYNTDSYVAKSYNQIS